MNTTYKGFEVTLRRESPARGGDALYFVEAEGFNPHGYATLNNAKGAITKYLKERNAMHRDDLTVNEYKAALEARGVVVTDVMKLDNGATELHDAEGITTVNLPPVPPVYFDPRGVVPLPAAQEEAEESLYGFHDPKPAAKAATSDDLMALEQALEDAKGSQNPALIEAAEDALVTFKGAKPANKLSPAALNALAEDMAQAPTVGWTHERNQHGEPIHGDPRTAKIYAELDYFGMSKTRDTRSRNQREGKYKGHIFGFAVRGHNKTSWFYPVPSSYAANEAVAEKY